MKNETSLFIIFVLFFLIHWVSTLIIIQIYPVNFTLSLNIEFIYFFLSVLFSPSEVDGSSATTEEGSFSSVKTLLLL